MHLELSDEALELRGTVDRLLDRHADLARVREVEPSGFDPRLWAMIAGLEIPRLGVPEQLGGQGADARTMAAVAESLGTHLAPVPVIEAMVANRLVARVDGLEGLGAHEHLTIAVRPAAHDRAALTPAGGVADRVVVLSGEELLLLDHPPASDVRVLGSMPLADVRIDRGTGTRVLASGEPAVAAYEAAIDEWRTLTAVALAGLAGEALRIGVEYANSRHQFGVPIGSFQAVSQAFADHATATEGARLLAYEAAWAADVDSPRAAALASMAFLFAARTAPRATAHALHVHGGYGFMLEYDIQMYFRRAKAWPLVLGPVPHEVELLATRTLGERGQGVA